MLHTRLPNSGLNKGSLNYDFVVLEEILKEKIAAVEEKIQCGDIPQPPSGKIYEDLPPVMSLPLTYLDFLSEIVGEIAQTMGKDSYWQLYRAHEFLVLQNKVDKLAKVLGEPSCEPLYQALAELKTFKD